MLVRRIVALALLLIVILLTVITLRARRMAAQRPRVSATRFGLVSVDTLQRRITFPAQVARNSGHALILINLTGYRWLDDSAAITSPAQLIHLQEALALLDWALWDSLWTGLQPQRAVRVFFRLGDSPALTGLLAESLALGEAVFTGIPELDGIVLHSHAGSDCTSCPAFAREQPLVIEAIRQRAHGFDLQSGSLPAPGTKLTVVIALPAKVP